MLVIKVLNTTTYIDWHFSEFIIKKLENIESKELCKEDIFQSSQRITLYSSKSSSKQFSWKDSVLYALKNFAWRIDKKESQNSREGKSAWKRCWEFFQSKIPKCVKIKIGFKKILRQKENEIQQIHEKYKQTILLEEYNKVIKERNDREALVLTLIKWSS